MSSPNNFTTHVPFLPTSKEGHIEDGRPSVRLCLEACACEGTPSRRRALGRDFVACTRVSAETVPFEVHRDRPQVPLHETCAGGESARPYELSLSRRNQQHEEADHSGNHAPRICLSVPSGTALPNTSFPLGHAAHNSCTAVLSRTLFSASSCHHSPRSINFGAVQYADMPDTLLQLWRRYLSPSSPHQKSEDGTASALSLRAALDFLLRGPAAPPTGDVLNLLLKQVAYDWDGNTTDVWDALFGFLSLRIAWVPDYLSNPGALARVAGDITQPFSASDNPTRRTAVVVACDFPSTNVRPSASLYHTEQMKADALWFLLLHRGEDATNCVAMAHGLLLFLRSRSGSAPKPSTSRLHLRPDGVDDRVNHPLHLKDRVGSLVHVPLHAVQLLASLVERISNRSVLRLERVTPPDRPEANVFSSAYELFFTAKERDLVIAACILLAWKQHDLDADVKEFLCCDEIERSWMPFREGGGALSAADYFSVFRQRKDITVQEIIRMETFVCVILHGYLLQLPLWWSVAMEVVEGRYSDSLQYLLAHDHISNTIRSAADAAPCGDGVTDVSGDACPTFLNYERCLATHKHNFICADHRIAREQLLLSAEEFLLLPSLLLHRIEDQKSEDTASMDRSEPSPLHALLSLYAHMAQHPLVGVALAVRSGAVPITWAASLVGPRGGKEWSFLSDTDTENPYAPIAAADRCAQVALRHLLLRLDDWFGLTDMPVADSAKPGRRYL